MVTHVKQEMLLASCEIGEGAARMRQDDLQVRILVERAGVNKFGRQEGVFNGGVDPSGEGRRPGSPGAAESVDRPIHLMKDDRIVKRLNTPKNRCKAGIEYIIVLFHGIRKMDGPYAGLSGNAVELFQSEFGVADRQLEGNDKAVGIFLVDFNARVVDDLREMRPVLS